MKKLLAVCGVVVLAGCMHTPRTTDPDELLASTGSPDVHRATFEVEVPYSDAYRNLLRMTRTCWQRSGTFVQWRVEGDLDPTAKHGTIFLTTSAFGKPEVMAAVRVRAAGGRAAIDAAAIKPRAGDIAGWGELPVLGQWARGERTECLMPGFLL